jgi:hypothetical protein
MHAPGVLPHPCATAGVKRPDLTPAVCHRWAWIPRCVPSLGLPAGCPPCPASSAANRRFPLRHSGIAAAPGPGGAAGSAAQQQRCPGAAVHVTCCVRSVTVRLHDPVVFSVDVVFSALFAEKATSTEKATSKAKVACGIRSPAGSVTNPAYRPASATTLTSRNRRSRQQRRLPAAAGAAAPGLRSAAENGAQRQRRDAAAALHDQLKLPALGVRSGWRRNALGHIGWRSGPRCQGTSPCRRSPGCPRSWLSGSRSSWCLPCSPSSAAA